MDIEEIKKLAKNKADGFEPKGSSGWYGVYYCFIFGYQECEKNNKK